MGLKVDLMPPSPRSIWEAIKKLQRDVQELRAARTLEASAVGAGGLTVQDPTKPERIVITPVGARFVPGPYYPPAVEFYSGVAGEAAPGQLMGYSVAAGTGPVPAIAIVTGDLGAGFAYLEIQSGNSTGDTPAMQLFLGTMGLNMISGVLTVHLPTVDMAIDASGIHFATESWTSLTPSNGWTATGGTWQAPIFHLQADNTVAYEGSLTPGTLTAGTVIATIPSSFYWPPADVEFRVPGGSATAYCDLVFHASNGTITIQNVAGTITRISLTGIWYSK